MVAEQSAKKQVNREKKSSPFRQNGQEYLGKYFEVTGIISRFVSEFISYFSKNQSKYRF